MRIGSEFYARQSQSISAEDIGWLHYQLWVRLGFAHGFYVTSESAEFMYKCTDYYAPEYERCIRWDDPELGIDWLILQGQVPLLSEKDAKGVCLQQAEYFP